MTPIPETKDISEQEQKRYSKLPFEYVWDNWYNESQGNHELLSDRYLLLWLKANASETYDYMKGLLEQWYDRRITSSEDFTKALERRVMQDGLMSINKDTYSSTPTNKPKKKGGCRRCPTGRGPTKCSERNSEVNDRGGQS